VTTPRSADLTRAVAVVTAAVTQIAAGPVTLLLLGPGSDQATISDANRSPVTPAGYAFAIWGLIYLAALILAVYQLGPGQQHREVHRRTGWWLVAAFVASTVWVPIFSTRTIWLSQLVIVGLVVSLAMAARRSTQLGPARGWGERLLLRLPITLYLGWATLATTAGFGTTFRSLGMPERGPAAPTASMLLVVAVTLVSIGFVARLSAIAGYLVSAVWALVAIAVGTYVGPVRVAALVAGALLLALTVRRTSTSRRRTTTLFG
jgi:hypothetical protein